MTNYLNPTMKEGFVIMLYPNKTKIPIDRERISCLQFQ